VGDFVKLKKGIFILLMFLLLIILFAFINNIKYAYLKEISYSDLNSMIEEEKDFILYISNEYCTYCKLFEPKLNSVANKYKLLIYKIDTATLTTDENKNFKSTVGNVATPTVVFFYEGVESGSSNRIEGNVSTQKIIDRLKANDYIKD